jgi:hypothetical protein
MPRLLAGLIAVAAWAGLATRVVVSYDGHLVVTLWAIGRYFTILTGLLVAVVMTAVALGRRLSPFTLAGVTLASILVGTVYATLLRHDVTGGRYLSTVLLHYVVPTGLAAYWLLFADKAGLAWRHPFAWILYPLAYFVYALVRGSIDGRYPYPFMDLNQISPVIAFRNAAAIAALFLIAGLAMVLVSRSLPRRADHGRDDA